MIRMGDREQAPLVPSPAEVAAEKWHRRQPCGTDQARWWCRCRACRTANPHYRRAMQAMAADIAERLNVLYDASRTEHVPRDDDRRKNGRGGGV